MIRKLYSVHDKNYKPDVESKDKDKGDDSAYQKDAKIKEKMYHEI